MERSSAIRALRNPKGVRFADPYFFGEHRQQRVYRTPWQGNPRVNIQNDKGTKEVRQVDLRASHYTYRVTWSAEDEEYVGLCAEFPSLSWLASTPEEAFSGIRVLVEDCVADMQANDEHPPEPMADRSYSGKFMVRVPPETHRALAIRAAEEGVSLNRLVSARLANDAL